MAMSDCIKCWDTPCTCGYEYRNMQVNARIKRAAVILGVKPEQITERMSDVVPQDHPMKGAK